MSDVGPLVTRELIREVRRLYDRIHGWTPGAWRVQAASSGTRAERVRELVVELVHLGREAGSGAPAGVLPPHLADHALADQIVVLADDVVEALFADASGEDVLGEAAGAEVRGPDRRHDIAQRARLAVRTARADLDGPRP
ncbi:hypothetical protein [Frankia sp. Cppng1_Ct_nod]|uniref:hypothetical protein n=1 Tax=Frankia sp. Cppng1_Ct_nod TaxID=2897162 RepID=UPI001041AC75|nr:hypothetical protein [Frankia sp. Cppng1_Ct_nod]